MKFLSIISLLFAVFFIPQHLHAQDKHVETEKKVVESKFYVQGVCGMCKKRIEKALDIPGVRFASWDMEKDTVTVIFRQDRVSLDSLKNRVTAVGHRTESLEADPKAYQELPHCCKYADGVEKH